MQHSENANEQNNEKKSKCGAWLWPFILALAGAITLALILRACNLKAGDGMLALTTKNHHSEEHGDEENGHHGKNTEHQGGAHSEKNDQKATGSVDTDGNYQYDLGTETELKLSNGEILKVGENSTEAKLFYFLSNPHAQLHENGNWFDFTNVNFKTGGEEITEKSIEQLKNLSVIINNFPNIKLKVGGYTDNTGNAEANKKLSQKRAENVAKALLNLGVHKDVISGAEGYGQEHPVASNDTPEGKAQNRRVSVNVKAK